MKHSSANTGYKKALDRERKKAFEQAHREKIRGLRDQIRIARRGLSVKLRELRTRIKNERANLRAKYRAERVRLAQELAGIRQTIKQASHNDVLNLKNHLFEEQKTHRLLKHYETKPNTRPRATRREKRQESEEFVLNDIPQDMHALFHKVKHKLKSGRMTTAEAFLQYAHEHPAEVLEAQGDFAEAEVARLVAEYNRANTQAKTRRKKKQSADLSDVPF